MIILINMVVIVNTMVFNPRLDEPRARPALSKVRLASDVKLPKPTYYIKTGRHYLDGKSGGPYMKVEVSSQRLASRWSV